MRAFPIWSLGAWFGLCTLADDNFSTFRLSRSYVLAKQELTLQLQLHIV
jgi:hypothetical protein